MSHITTCFSQTVHQDWLIGKIRGRFVFCSLIKITFQSHSVYKSICTQERQLVASNLNVDSDIISQITIYVYRVIKILLLQTQIFKLSPQFFFNRILHGLVSYPNFIFLLSLWRSCPALALIFSGICSGFLSVYGFEYWTLGLRVD